MEFTTNSILGSESEANLYNERCADLQIPDGLQFMNRLSVAEGSKVLDLGCGTGNLTVELAKRVGSKGHVTGVDPDGERIKVAHDKNTWDNTIFFEADGETFPEDQYDLVFSTYVLHWIENKDAVFKRVYNNLRPGGVFAFIITLNTPPLVDETTKLMKESVQRKIESKRHFVPTERLEKLANTNGFTVSLKETDISRHSLPDINSALEFIYASTNGRIDTAQANEKDLMNLRKKYSEGSVEFSEEIARMILTKI